MIYGVHFYICFGLANTKIIFSRVIYCYKLWSERFLKFFLKKKFSNVRNLACRPAICFPSLIFRFSTSPNTSRSHAGGQRETRKREGEGWGWENRRKVKQKRNHNATNLSVRKFIALILNLIINFHFNNSADILKFNNLH